MQIKIQSFVLKAVLFMIVFSGCLIAANASAAPESKSGKQPFTIEDSLSLEMIKYSSQHGISADGQYVAYAMKDEYQTYAKVDNIYHFVPRGFHVYVTSLASTKAFPITIGKEFS